MKVQVRHLEKQGRTEHGHDKRGGGQARARPSQWKVARLKVRVM